MELDWLLPLLSLLLLVVVGAASFMVVCRRAKKRTLCAIAERFRKLSSSFLVYKCNPPAVPFGQFFTNVGHDSTCAFCDDYRSQLSQLRLGSVVGLQPADAPVVNYKGQALHMVYNFGILLRILSSSLYDPSRLCVKIPEDLLLPPTKNRGPVVATNNNQNSQQLAQSWNFSFGKVASYFLAPLPRLSIKDDRPMANKFALHSLASQDFDLTNAFALLVEQAVWCMRNTMCSSRDLEQDTVPFLPLYSSTNVELFYCDESNKYSVRLANN